MVPPSQYSVTSEERDLSKSCEDLGMGVVCKALGSRRPPNQTSFRMPPEVSLCRLGTVSMYVPPLYDCLFTPLTIHFEAKVAVMS